MAGHSNIFLESLLQAFPIGEAKTYVLSSDELGSVDRTQNFFIICNLSKRGEEGTHFVSIIKKDQTLYFLDPLARYIFLNGDIPLFIQSFAECDLQKLRTPVQSEASHFCGLFALFFLYLYGRESITVPLEKFSVDDLRSNDCIVLRNLCRLFSAN